jgi:hypothetical protein
MIVSSRGMKAHGLGMLIALKAKPTCFERGFILRYFELKINAGSESLPGVPADRSRYRVRLSKAAISITNTIAITISRQVWHTVNDRASQPELTTQPKGLILWAV